MDLISLVHHQKKAFTISVRGHSIVTDMHPEDGGDDAGPNPTELFAASLASCIGMIAAEYCRNHDIPIDTLELSVVAQLADNPKRIQNVTIDLELPEGFPEKRKQAIRNAARTCVIYNTLLDPPEIDLEIV